MLSPAHAESYPSSARWSDGSPMALFEGKFGGLTQDYIIGCTTNKTRVELGEIIIARCSDTVKEFQVRTIEMSSKKKLCFLSWLRKRRPESYLAIQNCE